MTEMISRTGRGYVPVLLPAAALLLVLGCAGSGALVVARVNGRPVDAAALIRVLPRRVDTALGAQAVKQRYLDNIIDKELFIQEAERVGLDSSIAYAFELAQKGFVTQELYNSVVADIGPLGDAELESARQQLVTELNLKLIATETEIEAQDMVAGLRQGVPFETLAVRHSEHASAAAGGDLGWLAELWVDEPVMEAVLALEPGGWTGPHRMLEHWYVLKVDGRRAADPPPPPLEAIRGELTVRLRQKLQQARANEYLARVRARLRFNPEGLDVMCKPADSITPADEEVWVAIRDSVQYVRVRRLLHVVRRFPASLDTAMRKYAVRREIEEDLLYEDGLKQGLDKVPWIRDSLADRRRNLLYEALYRQEVTVKAEATEAELLDYYEEHKSSFPSADFEMVRRLVRSRMLQELRDTRRREYLAGLRDRARIDIDEKVLANIAQEPDGSWKHQNKESK